MIDRSKYLDRNEVKQLRTITENESRFDTIDSKTRGVLAWMVVDLALSTGLRVSELAAIKKQDIDFRRHLIKVVRLRRKRLPDEAQAHYNKRNTESIAISPRLQKHLTSYIKRSGRKTGPLFVSQRGGAMKSAGLRQIWSDAIRRAGLPKELSIYSARHTKAFHLLRSTRNLRQVQFQLGHSSPAVTATMYADVDFDEILDFDEMLEDVTGLHD